MSNLLNFDVYPEQIAFMAALAIFLMGMYIVARVHIKNENSLSKEEDFITEYIHEKKKKLALVGEMSIETYLIILLVAPVVLSVIGFFSTRNVFVALVLTVFGIRMPDIMLDIINMQTEKQFEERYAASLEQLGASLRAGKSIMQAVDDVAKAPLLHPTMKKRYAMLNSDLQMGLSVKDAFYRFAESTNSQDARDIALAIDIQNLVGGREADVVLKTANAINERIMLRKEISSIFSSTTSMVWMMDFLPIGVILGFCVTNKSYMEIYFSSPLNTFVFAVCVILPLVGSFVTHRTLNRIRRGA